MDSFRQWHSDKTNQLQFVNDFLAKSKESTYKLENGTEDEVLTIFNDIRAISFDVFFEQMLMIDTTFETKAADVPQFSSFEDGVQRLPELLEFAPDGLTFCALGYQLVKADRTGACIKYGENHSKLAKIMGLVTISREATLIVRSTSLGRLLLRYPMSEKRDVFRKILMREHLMQKIVSSAAHGDTNYREMVSCLSDSTAVRRRSNVRYLVNYILDGTCQENLLQKITW